MAIRRVLAYRGSHLATCDPWFSRSAFPSSAVKLRGGQWAPWAALPRRVGLVGRLPVALGFRVVGPVPTPALPPGVCRSEAAQGGPTAVCLGRTHCATFSLIKICFRSQELLREIASSRLMRQDYLEDLKSLSRSTLRCALGKQLVDFFKMKASRY